MGSCAGRGVRLQARVPGHKVAPRLGFPRRVVTAYLNSLVAQAQAKFAQAVDGLGPDLGNIRILKADGGTMTLEQSRRLPIESILSGPAASVMAALALSGPTGRNMVVVDIGGTTTDLAVVVAGEPVYAKAGAVIAGYPTAVPALFARSLGLGGAAKSRWNGVEMAVPPSGSVPTGRGSLLSRRNASHTHRCAGCFGAGPVGDLSQGKSSAERSRSRGRAELAGCRSRSSRRLRPPAVWGPSRRCTPNWKTSLCILWRSSWKLPTCGRNSLSVWAHQPRPLCRG